MKPAPPVTAVLMNFFLFILGFRHCWGDFRSNVVRSRPVQRAPGALDRTCCQPRVSSGETTNGARATSPGGMPVWGLRPPLPGRLGPMGAGTVLWVVILSPLRLCGPLFAANGADKAAVWNTGATTAAEPDRNAAGATAVVPVWTKLRSSVVRVPLLNRFSPKLSAVAVGGIGGVTQVAWVYAVAGANQGLEVQYCHNPFAVR